MVRLNVILFYLAYGYAAGKSKTVSYIKVTAEKYGMKIICAKTFLVIVSKCTFKKIRNNGVGFVLFTLACDYDTR